MDASVEDLLTEDVGVAGVPCELADPRQLQGPHQTVATTVDDVIEGGAAMVRFARPAHAGPLEGNRGRLGSSVHEGEMSCDAHDDCWSRLRRSPSRQ